MAHTGNIEGHNRLKWTFYLVVRIFFIQTSKWKHSKVSSAFLKSIVSSLLQTSLVWYFLLIYPKLDRQNYLWKIRLKFAFVAYILTSKISNMSGQIFSTFVCCLTLCSFVENFFGSGENFWQRLKMHEKSKKWTYSEKSWVINYFTQKEEKTGELAPKVALNKLKFRVSRHGRCLDQRKKIDILIVYFYL